MKKFKFELLAKLNDGTPIVFDGDFLVGTAVFTIDAEGQKQPAPDGELTLEDGSKFTVKGGLIESIPAEAEPAPVEQAEQTPEPVTLSVEDVNKRVEELFALVTQLQGQIELFNQEKQLMETNINEKFSAITVQSATKKEPEIKVEKTYGELVIEKINQIKVKQ